jgi:sortase (surface protein transpeptidase)
MHLAINLPADIDYSARAYVARRRIPLALLAGASLALVFVMLPAARGGASSPPAESVAAVVVPPAVVVTSPTAAPAPPAATEAPAPAPSEAQPRPLFPPGVPGDVVVRLVIPSIGVNAGIERVGVDAGGTMEAPDDGVRAVGWYNEWATPGAGGGNTVFSAHETWNLQRAPFYALNQLAVGDTLTVVMRSGAEYRYVVANNRRYLADAMPLGQIIWPSARPEAEEWATFITCGGRYVRTANGYFEYLERDVIVARRVA